MDIAEYNGNVTNAFDNGGEMGAVDVLPPMLVSRAKEGGFDYYGGDNYNKGTAWRVGWEDGLESTTMVMMVVGKMQQPLPLPKKIITLPLILQGL